MDKAGNSYPVMAYIMTRKFEREPSYPSMSYYTGIAQGYEQNGIPLKGLRDALSYSRKEIRAQEGGSIALPRRKSTKDFER